MSDKFFLDTNILVYTFDHADRARCKKARTLLGHALEDRKGIISYQVVQEFVNVATRKFVVPMTGSDIALYFKAVLLPLCEIHSSTALFQRAMAIHEDTQFSFYDSLIVAAAVEGECRILYSEDLQHSRAIDGVRIMNPF